jgi:ABC-type phosphate transport system substrate-binding protein
LETRLLCIVIMIAMLLSQATSSSIVVSVSAAASAPAVAGSINAVFLDLFRQSLLAYQLQVPTFTGVTLTSNSGDAGLTAAASGLYDWTIATSSVSDKMRRTNPTLESYPLATVGIAPAYNLPTATVGTATLSLHSQVMCRIWRGNITRWSVAVHQGDVGV